MDLETTLASLQLNDSEKKPEERPKEGPSQKTVHLKYEKRRVYTKPVKKYEECVKKREYYLDKRIKSCLETIYEEKEEVRINGTGVKKKGMKVRSVSSQQRKHNKLKVPLSYLKEKLKEIEKGN